MVLRPRNGLSLCAGGGGLDMGLMLAEPGFHTRCWVEWEEYPRSVIVAAQRSGYFAPAPIWDDLTTFDARPFAGCIDTLLAGYPCQPFSHAGQRNGSDDERHLWPDVARVARELGPSLEWIILENVAGHVTLGLETVLRDLRDMDFTPAVGLFTAAETGAPHERERVFIVAHRQGPDWWGEQQAGRTRSGRAGPSGGGAELGNTNGCDDARGLDARAVGREAGRSQAGHEGSGDPSHRQRVRAQSGGTGYDLEHATGLGRGKGRAEPEVRSGRNSPASAGGTMADTTGARCEPARPGPSGEREGGQPLPRSGSGTMDDAARGGRGIHARSRGEGVRETDAGGSGSDMADASGGAGHQGRPSVSGSGDGPRGSGETTGPGGSRPYVHPPGPADMGRWADVLVTSPDLAPSASFGDLASFAGQVAAMAQAGLVAEAEIEPALRRMADGLALRSRALRLLGNGVHPLAAGHAWRTLSAAHGLRPLDLASARDGDGAGADEFDMRKRDG